MSVTCLQDFLKILNASEFLENHEEIYFWYRVVNKFWKNNCFFIIIVQLAVLNRSRKCFTIYFLYPVLPWYWYRVQHHYGRSYITLWYIFNAVPPKLSLLLFIKVVLFSLRYFDSLCLVEFWVDSRKSSELIPGSFLQDFLHVLKHMLQNMKKISFILKCYVFCCHWSLEG